MRVIHAGIHTLALEKGITSIICFLEYVMAFAVYLLLENECGRRPRQ